MKPFESKAPNVDGNQGQRHQEGADEKGARRPVYLIEGNAAEHSRRDSASASARSSYRRSVWRCLHGVLLGVISLDQEWYALGKTQPYRSGSIDDATPARLRFHHLASSGFRFPHALRQLCQEARCDESPSNASSWMSCHSFDQLSAPRDGVITVFQAHRMRLRCQLGSRVRRAWQSMQRPLTPLQPSSRRSGTKNSLCPAIVRSLFYSQPDRLNPNHSPLQTTAITPRTTQ